MKLEVLLLAEGILILLIICGLLLFYALKQRELHRHILEEYRKLRLSISLGIDPTADRKNSTNDAGLPSPATDHIAQFLAQANQQALERFKKITHATVPRLGADLSFSAKVAALRFLYTEAEAEIHRQPASLHGRWMTLEKKYADIVRWIGKPTESQKPERNYRLRLLQERIDALKPFEEENVRLVRKLALANARQEKQEQQLKDGQQTILAMQKTIRTLQRKTPGANESPEQKRQGYLHYTRQEHLDDAVIAHDQGVGQLNSITDISNQKGALLRKISDELHITFANISVEQRQKLEDVIRTLERELLQSDHHITNLRKELKTTRETIPHQPFIFAGKGKPKSEQSNIENFYAQSSSPEKKAEKIEEVLKVVHMNLAEGERNLNQNESEQWNGHKRTLEEIQNLRLNNQGQRNMIVDLEKQLRSLRREAQETDDETVSEEKYRDITRLEKLVKECEYCIETLESEVDLLYMQLQQSQTKAPAPAEAPLATDILRLNHELETVSGKLKETAKQYQKTHSFNQFTLDILTCDSIETIARRLIQTIKDLNIIAGFSLRSTLGHAEYYAGEHFSAQEKIRIKKAPSDTAIGYLNEGILFTNKHIHLMLKSPPDEDAELSALEHTLTSSINIAAERLQHLEAEHSLKNHAQSMGEWVGDIKRHLTKVDMQYAHQAEESRRVVDNLIKELNHATGMIDMSGSARAVFDNAISECRDRINILMETSKNTDQDFSRLLEDLDKVAALTKSHLNH